jgi:DNA-binding response OmpR family regulator
LTAGRITLDVQRRRVEVAGNAVALAPREFSLLQILLESRGRVLSREQLLERAWGYANADDIESRTVDVHVRRLRAKLGDEGARIVTVKAVGYQLTTD